MAAPVFSFEPLTDHDRSTFSSGVPELDRYLHPQASQDARRHVAAPFVMLNAPGLVVGYYTLSAYGVRVEEIPVSLEKKLPRNPLLPTTLLVRLAVDH